MTGAGLDLEGEDVDIDHSDNSFTYTQNIFSTEESRPSPVWLDWFSPVRLAGFKGNTLLIAWQPGPARDTLQEALDHLPEDSAKQRSVILGDLAAVARQRK